MNQKHLIGENASSLDVLGVTPSISKVLLFYDDENAFISENGTEGYTIEAFCPSATQEMADNILASVSGYAHKGFAASDVQLPPIAEMGDWLSINGEWYRMCERDLEFGPASLSNVSAPAENDVDHEYPYTSSEKREINRKIATTRSQITKTAEEIKLQVEATDGRVSKIQQTVDGISSRVSDAEDNISELEQTAGQVKVSVTDDAGTLSTTINAKVWEALRKNLEGETTSGFYFDFALGRFVYDGTGVFRSEDGSAYIEIENDALVLYGDSGSGDVIKKLQIGFISSSGVDYPYIQLGAGGNDNDPGLIKKFANGVYIGTGAAKDAAGDFNPKAGYAGIFTNTVDGKTYVIEGTNMMTIYTGDAIARFG